MDSNKMYITIIGFDKYHGSKPFRLNAVVKLIREPDNRYDAEAISCHMRHFGQIGYVANSTSSVIKGTMSAGRTFDKIEDGYIAKIEFITSSRAIARILACDEYMEEMENPESDIHYIKEA